MSTTRKDEQRSGTRVRVPMGARRQKLQLSDAEYTAIRDAGFVPRWVNDADGRVEAALAGGYQFVKPDEARSVGAKEFGQGNTDVGGKVSKVVSRGDPVIRAYLMKIEQAFYDEDKADKEKVNARVDEALAGGEIGGAGVENKYVPGGGDALKYSK